MQIVKPIDKGKLAIFSSLVQTGTTKKRLDVLIIILGDRYEEGSLDTDIFDQAVSIVNRAKGSDRDEQLIRQLDRVEKFCGGKLSAQALRVALDAIKRRRLRAPEIQTQLEELK